MFVQITYSKHFKVYLTITKVKEKRLRNIQIQLPFSYGLLKMHSPESCRTA